MNDPSLKNSYQNDGFFFPVDVISPQEATTIAQDFELAENSVRDDLEKSALLKSYPDRVLPSFDKLIRHPQLISAVSQVLGPNLLVWSAGLFIKEANTDKVVSWHQDLTYWGLDDAQELTAWVALSYSTSDSGCMRFIPGSHQKNLVPHSDTFDENNLLTRGQTIAVDVDENESVSVELKPGQASLHHGHLFHASGPNTTSYRRIGAAIRYITPEMKQQSGARSLVALASGEDRFNHFSIAPSPLQRLASEDFNRCKADALLKREILYAGAEEKKGTRY
ncbi:MAG: phytanoyl-CoA dioxygenase family protein [Gammaproteobacteria bacterium]|nr:phytanoyl-CoA dioxygenase family protein [Gammaproteobacteria bacterium]